MDFETIYDVVRENRASIERESERLKTRATLNEAIEALLEEYETLKSQNNEMAQEIASANKQLDAMTLKNEKLQSENEHEDLIHALKVYMNLSKRKTAKKRGYIKMAILELVAAASVILPEDMKNELETFDDDMQQQQVNVQAGGIYVQQADTVA